MVDAVHLLEKLPNAILLEEGQGLQAQLALVEAHEGPGPGHLAGHVGAGALAEGLEVQARAVRFVPLALEPPASLHQNGADVVFGAHNEARKIS